MEVVAAEAVVPAVLAGGVDRQWSGDRDLVFAGCLFQMDQGGVAAVDQVLGGQQPAVLEPGVDAGQSLRVVAGGVGGGHICDHVDAVGITGLGEMCDETLPPGDMSAARIAGRRVVGRDDRDGRGRQPAVLHGAPAQAAGPVTVVVLNHDLPQGLDAGPGQAFRPVPPEVLDQPDGVVSGGEDPGLGAGGVLAQTDRAAVAAPPLLVDQAGQQVRSRAGQLFQRGADGLGDQFQPGQVAHCGQDVGGVRALGGALADETGLLQAREREVEETVGSAVLGETVAEVGQHAVVEAGIVQFHGQRVLEIDAAANRFGRLPVRQTEEELEHTDGGQLGGRETWTAVTRIPVGEVLVTPQPVQAVSHPHRRRTARVARPRHPHGQRRDLLTRTGTERQRAPR